MLLKNSARLPYQAENLGKIKVSTIAPRNNTLQKRVFEVKANLRGVGSVGDSCKLMLEFSGESERSTCWDFMFFQQLKRAVKIGRSDK